MVYDYKTIAHPSEGSYKEKGSKFLAFAYPVQTLEAINTHLDQLHKQYFDARHHCYAYILNPEKDVFRANDDGEPGHSAGDPILGQIRSADLTNVLIVVVRYFGGTKLGVSGLINAYKTAAHEALNATKIVERRVMKHLEFHFTYPATNEVMKLIGTYQVKITEQIFEADCRIKGQIPLEHLENLMSDVALQQHLGVNITLNL